MWTIYLLRDPRNPSVGYVGQTRHTPERRLRQHLAQAARGPTRPLCVWLRELKSAAIAPTLRELERCVSADDADAAERRWIRWARKGLGLRLVNATAGGQARYGDAHSARVRQDWARPERRAKARAAWGDAARHAERGRAISEAHQRPEVRARNAAASRAKANRPQQKRIVSETHRALWADPDHRAMRSAAVAAGVKRRYDNDPEYREQVAARCRAQAKRAAEARWGKR